MTTQSVEKAVAILRQFSATEPQLGVSELARRLGMTKSNVHRLLSTLVKERLMAQDPETRQYRLGHPLVRLGHTVVYSDPLMTTVQPYLHYVAHQMGEASYLAERCGDKVATLLQVIAPNLREPIGWYPTLRLHSTSTGKVLLAHAEQDDVDRFLAGGLPRSTEHTITDPAEVRKELQLVREQGFATCLEEENSGLNAVAVPIMKHDDGVLAAMAVVGPAYSLTREKLMASVEILKGVSAEITRKLG